MSEQSKYKFPEDNENVLHIDSDCLPLSQERLLEKCQEHFGEDVALDMFSVDILRFQNIGCGCCYDASDWTNYLKLERITKKDN